MSSTGFLIFLGFIAACAIVIWAMVRVARARGAPDRERTERLRVQGNFVPLSREDVAEDARRQALRAAGQDPAG
jgi:hypothetical protein